MNEAKHIEKLFRSGTLSQFQIDQLVKILHVLAKYMLVDRNILNYRAGEKIGLSHIQRAINLNFIIEIQDAKAAKSVKDIEDKHYFYLVGYDGINFLKLTNKKFHCFDLDTTFEDKKKVLLMNYDAAEKNYDLLFSSYNDKKYYNFYHLKDFADNDVILYFKEYITESHIKSIMKRNFINSLSEEQFESRHELFTTFLSKFRFETIKTREITYTKDLKRRDSNFLAESRFDTELE